MAARRQSNSFRKAISRLVLLIKAETLITGTTASGPSIGARTGGSKRPIASEATEQRGDERRSRDDCILDDGKVVHGSCAEEWIASLLAGLYSCAAPDPRRWRRFARSARSEE